MSDWVQPMANPRDCIHGHLARSCELCERDEEIHDLRAELGQLRENYEAMRLEWSKSVDERDDALARAADLRRRLDLATEGWQRLQRAADV